MEQFRVRNSSSESPRRLLLPISGGLSSTTLLHILDGHVGGQYDRIGRAGYQLHVLFADTASDNVQPDVFFEGLKIKYPRHNYHRVNLLNHPEKSEIPSGESQHNASHLIKSNSLNLVDLTTLLPSLSSATSRADIHNISLMRTVTQTAHELSCEAILWGSTTTRLAERILAETAKGRGFSLPWLVNDGESPYYGIHFVYPMKDLLRRELPHFADAVDLPILQDVVEQTSGVVSSKNVTIDSLMKEYFESVEESYPNIVTNVVKTSSKLSIPPSENQCGSCKLCGIIVTDGAYGLHGWGGSESPETPDKTNVDGMNDRKQPGEFEPPRWTVQLGSNTLTSWKAKYHPPNPPPPASTLAFSNSTTLPHKKVLLDIKTVNKSMESYMAMLQAQFMCTAPHTHH